MSEPLSLYAKFTIDEDGYNRFLQSPIEAVSQYKDWMPWLATKTMYGTISQKDLEGIRYTQPNNGAHLADTLLDDYPFPGNGMMAFDNVELTIASINFSENYREMIYILNVLRSIGNFMKENEQGFILVYDHFWESGIDDFALKISSTENTFVQQFPQEWKADAMLLIKARIKQFED